MSLAGRSRRPEANLVEPPIADANLARAPTKMRFANRSPDRMCESTPKIFWVL